MKKTALSVILGAAVLYSAIAQGALVSVDVWEMFPNTQGENGFYALAYNTSNGQYRELQDRGAYSFWTPQTTWNRPQIDRFPNEDIRIESSGRRSSYGGVEDAVLSWMVPETNTYEITGGFHVDGGSWNGVYTYVKAGDRLLWAASLDGQTRWFDLEVDLDFGESILFGVNSINNNSFSEANDWSLLKAPVIAYDSSPVPIPPTAFLFGSGLASLGFLRCSRKKA
ncbi:MAG: hypothetical protein K9J80_16890 [Sulfuritalea sp.]|nr:hypothetical protein [Sulfuritalea sp.]